jgi:hypothetical protein
LKLHGDETFDGPLPDRRCTDVLFLILFLVANAAFIGATSHVVLQGDTDRLTKGYDFRAEICGIDDLEDLRFMYYPDVNNLDFSLWIVACPYYYVEEYYYIYEEDHTTLLLDWPSYDTYLTKAFGFYWLPAEKDPREDVLEVMRQPMEILRRAAGDLMLTWDVILAGTLLSFTIGIFYLLAFRVPGIVTCVVYTSMLACLGLIGYLAYLFWEAGERIFE